MSKVFLSYSHKDEVFVEKLYHKLNKDGVECFFDKESIAWGSNWVVELEKGVDNCEIIVLILSPDYCLSEWAMIENTSARTDDPVGLKRKIRPLLLKDCKDCLPRFLKPIQQIDISTPSKFDQEYPKICRALKGMEIESDISIDGGLYLPDISNPYQGLTSFTEKDAQNFFGRDQEIEKFVDQFLSLLDTTTHEPSSKRILPVLGPSGSGKSSLVKAGLIPRIRQRFLENGWGEIKQLLFTPQTRPLRQLAIQLAQLTPDDGQRTQRIKGYEELLSDTTEGYDGLVRITDELEAEAINHGNQGLIILVIDQFEELYTLNNCFAEKSPTNEQTDAFIANLLKAVSDREGRVAVILTLRTDFFDLVSRHHPELAAICAAQKSLVGPLTKEGLHQVIFEPAAKHGYPLDESLITLLVEQTLDRDGALPLLQAALSAIWTQLMQGVPAAETLREIGGVGGALRKQAEDLYKSLHASDQKFAMQVLLSMVRLGDGSPDTRRRVLVDELLGVGEGAKKLEYVLQRLAGTPLNPTDPPPGLRLIILSGDSDGNRYAEVAHETLLHSWERLGRWIENNRDNMRIHQRIRERMQSWRKDGEPVDRLLPSGRELEEGRQILTEAGSIPIADVTPYIHQSIKQDRLLKRRWVITITTVIFILASLSAIAVWFAFDAKAKQQEAQKQTDIAVARRLASIAEKTFEENIGETTLAGLLAVESLKRTPTLEGKQVLRRVLELTPKKYQEVGPPSFSRVSYSPDGSLIAISQVSGDSITGSAAGSVAMIDTSTWHPSKKYLQQGKVWPAFSPDGHWMAIAGYGRRLQVIDRKQNNTVLDVHQDDMVDVVFGRSNRQLFIVRTDGVIEVRTAPEWQVTSKLNYPLKNKRVNKVKAIISKDGRQLLVQADGRSFLIFTDNDAHLDLKHGEGYVATGLLSPFGDYAVTAFRGCQRNCTTYGRGHELIIWDTQSGKKRDTYPHDKRITAIAISPDSQKIISATETGEVIVREADSGSILQKIKHAARVNHMAISENGKYLVTAGDDRLAVLWNLDNGKKVYNLTHTDEVWTAEFIKDDQVLLTGSKDGLLHVYDVKTGKEIHKFKFDGSVIAIRHEPVSGTLAIGIRETKHDQAWTDLVLLDSQTNAKVAQIEHNGSFRPIRQTEDWNGVVFSPDNTMFATINHENKINIWNTKTGKVDVVPDVTAVNLVFSPDSSRLIIEGYPLNEIVILDASNGKRLTSIGEPGGIDIVKIARDRHTVTSFGKDGTFRGWDALTGKEQWRRETKRSHIKISGNGKRFADFSSDKKFVEIGEVRTGDIIARIPVESRAFWYLSENGSRMLITSNKLTDESDPKHKYSVVKLWNIDKEKQLFKKRYDFPFTHTQILPDDRIAIFSSVSKNKKNSSLIEVIGAENGTSHWSFSSEYFLSEVVHAEQSNSVMLVQTKTDTEVRNLATGTVIFKLENDWFYKVTELKSHSQLVFASKRKSGNLDEGDRWIEVRDAKNGELIHEINVNATILSLNQSVDEKYLIATTMHNSIYKVKVWRTQDWSEIASIELADKPKALVVLDDPDLFATHTWSGIFKVWRISTATEEHTLYHAMTGTGFKAASKVDRAVTWEGAFLRVWNTASGAEIAHRLSHGSISAPEISPDGRIVAYQTKEKRRFKQGGDFKAAIIWEPDSDSEPIVLPMEDPREIRFEPTGSRLVVSHRNNSVQIIDIATLRTISSIPVLAGSSLKGFSFSSSPDGVMLFIEEKLNKSKSAVEGGVRVFNLDSMQEIARIDTHGNIEQVPQSAKIMTREKKGVSWRAWSLAENPEMLWKVPKYTGLLPFPSTGRLLSHSNYEGVEVIGLEKGKSTRILPRTARTDGRIAVGGQFVNRVKVSQEGKYIVVGASNHQSAENTDRIVIHNAVNGAEVARLDTGITMSSIDFVNNSDAIVMSDTPGVVKGSTESKLWLWNWRKDELLKLSDNNPINAIEVNPNGSMFATAEGSEDFASRTETNPPTVLGIMRVRIWDAQTGKELRQISLKNSPDHLAFSADGQFLAVKQSDKIIVYALNNWKVIKELAIKSEGWGSKFVTGKVVFGAENRLITDVLTNFIPIWDLEGNEKRLLRSIQKGKSKFKFSRDRRLLVTQEGQILRIYDVINGVELFQTKLVASIDNFVFAGTSGDALFVSSDKKLLRILWKTDDLIAEACRRFGRNMSEKEWQRFIDDKPFAKTCMTQANDLL